jgi:ABC-type siderophore export system fused ATPase/permease subunit
MRASGRLVIVVTHDDRYFSRADRLLVLERGAPAVIVPASMAGQASTARADVFVNAAVAS